MNIKKIIVPLDLREPRNPNLLSLLTWRGCFDERAKLMHQASVDHTMYIKLYGYHIYVNTIPSVGGAVWVFNTRQNSFAQLTGFNSMAMCIDIAFDIYLCLLRFKRGIKS